MDALLLELGELESDMQDVISDGKGKRKLKVDSEKEAAEDIRGAAVRTINKNGWSLQTRL